MNKYTKKTHLKANTLFGKSKTLCGKEKFKYGHDSLTVDLKLVNCKNCLKLIGGK